jgi:hypothetical protein
MTEPTTVPEPEDVLAAARAGSLGPMVESVLAVLVGEPLVSIGRAVDMGTFGFGPEEPTTTRRGIERMVAAYSLHLQCPFRMDGPTGPIFGGRDIYRSPTGERLEGMAWDGPDANFYEVTVKARGAIDGPPLVCERIVADRSGSFTIHFTEDHVLHVFVPGAVQEEYWRFFRTGDLTSHVVIHDEPD